MCTRRLAALLALLSLSALGAAALELDLGFGGKIDVASYGIENVTALVAAAPWIGSREGLQEGLVLAGSAGPAKVDLELSACLRVWPAKGAIALFEGGGLVAERGPGPTLCPMLIGGIRLEAGRFGLDVCGEIHYEIERGDTDTMLWLALLWRAFPP
jgi:hypothetical protein